MIASSYHLIRYGLLILVCYVFVVWKDVLPEQEDVEEELEQTQGAGREPGAQHFHHTAEHGPFGRPHQRRCSRPLSSWNEERHPAGQFFHDRRARSEERRVGKECRL